jgi:hypothetical protein
MITARKEDTIMKTMFTKPEIEVLKFAVTDVVTASGDENAGVEDEF